MKFQFRIAWFEENHMKFNNIRDVREKVGQDKIQKINNPKLIISTIDMDFRCGRR